MIKEIEIWKPIPNVRFEISSFGRIKRLAKYIYGGNGSISFLEEKIGYGWLSSNGYLTIRMDSKITGTIHRMVATAFLPNPDNLRCVNHKDGDKLNNNINNLEWSSYGDNERHAYKIGMKVGAWKGKTGKNHNRSKLYKNGN